jgi:hypothetical protein
MAFIYESLDEQLPVGFDPICGRYVIFNGKKLLTHSFTRDGNRYEAWWYNGIQYGVFRGKSTNAVAVKGAWWNALG